jgi:hypothetical protein
VPVKSVAAPPPQPVLEVAPPAPIVPEPVPAASPPAEVRSKVRIPKVPVVDPQPVSAPPLLPSQSALAAELELLRTAKTELDAARWETALEAISRHDSEFPEGVLTIEAEVIRVLAWCGQGRLGEALERAHELRTKFPNSPAITRLAGSCVEL